MILSESNIEAFALENCHDGIFMFDQELRYTFMNKAMEELTGYSRTECLGKKAAEMFPFLINSGKIDLYKRILNGESFQLRDQMFFSTEKGKFCHYNAQYHPVYAEGGNVKGGMIIVQDRSLLFAAIQALKDAEDRNFHLLEKAPLSMVVFSEEEVLYVNQVLLELLNASTKEQILGKSPFCFITAANREKARQDIKAIFAGELVAPVQYELIRLDGSTLFSEIVYIPIYYQGKRAIQAILRDTTLERKTYEELLQLKELLSETQKMARMGSYQLFLEDNSLFWSDELYQIFELEKGKVVPNFALYRSFLEEPAEAEELDLLLQQLMSGALEKVTRVHHLLLPSGSRKYVRLIGHPSYNERGEIETIVGSLQDITEQRQAETELFHANQVLNLHFENSLLGIVQLNNKLEVVKWSRQAERLFGWQASEVLGKYILNWPFIHESDQEIVSTIKHKIQGGNNFTCKSSSIRLNTKKKTIVFCELFVSGISSEDGRLNSVFILLNDITARQLSEQARAEGQEEERKRIAREIHDGIGQMLIAIKYKVASLEDAVAENQRDELLKLEGMLEQTIEEARSISKNLAPRSVATLGLESSLRQMCEQIKKLTALDLKFRYIGGEQVVNNKTVNALYRIAQEASQNIVKHAQATEANLQVFQGRNFIELKVEDNGTGISEKGPVGNGLKNMEERVKLLGGRFQIYSEDGKGTSLIVNIPLKNDPTEN